MRKYSLFKKTVLVSLFGHLTVFTIFGFSFSGKSVSPFNPDIIFWGRVLSDSQVARPQPFGLRVALPLKAVSRDIPVAAGKKYSDFPQGLPALKPQLSPAANTVKAEFSKEEMSWIKQPKVKEPVLIFHPALPYDFSLLFKDRQTAHVELDFKVNPKEEPEAIVVKRRVSSGNLEVDLLSLRYIEHYLFIQESRFVPDKWQTIKIDLSGRND